MSQILTQPVGLYSYLDTKLSILENRPKCIRLRILGTEMESICQMSTEPSTPSDNFCNLYIGMVSLDSNLLVLIHLPLKEWSIRCLLTNIK